MPVIELSSIQSKEIAPGYDARFVHGDQITCSFVDIKAGAKLKEHFHVHEQIMQVLQGEFELTLAGEPIRFGPGTVVVIPSNTPHSGYAITDCRVMDVFSPVREDYRAL